MGHLRAARDDRVDWRVGKDVVHRPAHVRDHGGPERAIGGQPRVVEGSLKAADEALAEIAHVAVAGVHAQQPRLAPAAIRVRGRPARHLRPVGGEPLDVLRVLVGARERVLELGVGEAAPVVRPGHGEERVVAADGAALAIMVD